ncbi:twin-arginine translocase subunit TatC [Bacillus horti]|uniref:Sec-independent protein translocase protein TatC n=1 Tax=Caldalkalibacillus horti TaxID=77523 RepID=A0ABT9W4X0_9BACI|nr:twin-arginine translocase subunit TatC [Bacillus horti]MDQ0168294.1 sec-independent protein translocase protein TatC [Bacillus horti]
MAKQTQMTMWDHIGELRKRLIYVLIVFVVSMLIGFFFAEEAVSFLKAQVADQLELAVFSPTDAFKVYLQFAIAVALIITLPFVLYHIWAFVRPGLTSQERKLTLSYIPGGAVLFLMGLSFGYFLLFPFVLSFMTGIATQLGANELYGMAQYFGFLFALVIPFGFIFQMPLIILFLTSLGIITPIFLRKIRKFAYFALFVLAAVITPPELLSHLLVTLPLILLYEISIWFSSVAYRRVLKNKEQAYDQ